MSGSRWPTPSPGIGRGDDWVWIGGVKGYMDGSLGSTTAYFYQPYDDDPSTSGLLTTPEDSMRAWIGAADSAGLQVVVHAIGERANGLLLQIYDSVAQAHGPRDRRFRIEHAQHLRREDIGRFGQLGVVASMQPYHAIDDGRWAEKRIGPERIKTTYAFRSLLDQGAVLAFGSDWTVAPIDPLLGIYAAVTRRTLDGKNPKGWVPRGEDHRRGGAPRLHRGQCVRRVRRGPAGEARAGLPGGSGPARPGPHPDPAGGDRAGGGEGDRRGRACRVFGA